MKRIIVSLAAIAAFSLSACTPQQVVDAVRSHRRAAVVTPVEAEADPQPMPPMPVPDDYYIGQRGVYLSPDEGYVLNPAYAPDYPNVPPIDELPSARPRR